MATADPQYDPPITIGSGTTSSSYLSRAQALTGIGSDAFAFFDDFEYAVSQVAQKWAQSSSGSAGSNFPVSGTRAGWVRLNTGATAGSTFDLTTQIIAVDNSRNAPWYMAARFKVSSAIDSAALVAVGLDDGSTQSVMAGFTGPAHATNFSVQYAGRFTGSAINFGVAADTSTHIYEMWSTGDGVTLFARLDNGAVLSAVPGVSVANAIPRVVNHNGATAANRSVDLDWTLFVTGRSS